MKKKLTLFFLHDFFGSLDFTRGIFVIFLMSRGMTMGSVGILQTLLFWSTMVCEVPAGFFADHFKRKYSVAAGLILFGSASFLMPYAQTMKVYALAFILYGAGFAFRSGADKALLYDELNAGDEVWAKRYVKMAAWARGLANIGLVIAMVTGGFIQKAFGWHVVYAAVGAVNLLAAFFVLAIQERPHKAPAKAEENEKAPGLVQSVKIFFSSPEGRSLALFILGMGFIEAMHAAFFIYIQTYLEVGGLSSSMVSLVIGLSLGLTSLGYLFVDRFEKVPFWKLVRVSSVLLVGMISVFLFKPTLIVGIMLFALIEMVPSLLFVHSDTFINHQLPSRVRASLLSVHSLINSIFVSLAFLGGGYLLDHFPAAQVLGSLAVLPLISVIFFTVYFWNAKAKATEVEAT